MTEHEIQNEIRLAVSRELPNVRLFRANVGAGWVGTVAERTTRRLVLANYRRFDTGLPKGMPDLIGFRRNADGRAQFAFIEVKTPTGRARPEQKHMIEFLLAHGAVGGIARSAEEAVSILRGGESHDDG